MIENFGQFFVVSEKRAHRLFLEFNNGASVLIATNDSLDHLENVRAKSVPIIRKCFELKDDECSPLDVSDEIDWKNDSGVQRSEDRYFGYFEITEQLSKNQSEFDLSIVFHDKKVLFDSYDSKEKAEKMAEGLNRAFSFC